MKEFYMHGQYNVLGACRHFSTTIKAENKDEAVKKFLEKYGQTVYLTEVYDVNYSIPTQVD